MEKRNKRTRWQGVMSRKCYRKRHKRWAASADKRNRTLPMDQQIHDALGQYMAECTASPTKEPKEPKVDKDGGTYAGVRFDATTVKNLTEYVEYLTHAMGLKEPTDPEEFHTTIVYSRKTVPAFKAKSFDEPVEVTPKKNRGYRLELFGTDKTTLVLTYRSPVLQERFDDATKLGATTDFPNYQPHVTIAYNATKAAAKGAKWLRQFKLPDFPLVVREEYVEPIDEDWKDKVKEKKDKKKAKRSKKASAAVLVSTGMYSLLAYFNGDFEGAGLVETPPVRIDRPNRDLFAKSGAEIVKGLLKSSGGDPRRALVTLSDYRNRSGNNIPNAASLKLAQSLLHERLPLAEAAE